MNEYKSIEERIYDSLKPIGRGINSTIKKAGYYLKVASISSYGIFKTPLVVSSTIRKNKNEQTLTDRFEFPFFEKPLVGLTCIVGSIVGATPYILGYLYSSHELDNQNIVPLVIIGTILGITNLASGLYEIGRLSKSKQEKAELNEKSKHSLFETQT